MKQLFIAQEMARRNNENGVVFAAYQRRRRLRRFSGKKKTQCTVNELDELDWQAAEREARPVRAVGFFLART